ncbi:protein-export chaperone SecB [Magnetococcales bacterium HHB-1]
MDQATDGKPQVDPNAPAFRPLKLYLKDLSFESPNAPKCFTAQAEQPKIEFHLENKVTSLEEDRYEVALNATLKAVGKDMVLFLVEVSYAGIFLIRNIPKEHLAAVMQVECPTILFPYLRQLVGHQIMEGGFQPLMLEPINFAAVYQDKMRKAQEEGEQATQQ